MDDDDAVDFSPNPAAHSMLISLSRFPPFPALMRLSSQFVERTQPVQSQSARKLAWLSLQGRIVNADEASSARVIGGGLSMQEAVAWEMFSPMHRILIVAIVAVAAAQSRKNVEIWKLKESVDLRDQVLSIMQQKLDNLCEQMNCFKGQPLGGVNLLTMKSEGIFADEASDCENTPASGLKGLGPLGYRRHSFASYYSMGPSQRTSIEYNDIMHPEHLINKDDQQEERRLSGLSDWGSSITSSSDLQLVSLEQDCQNLKKQNEEKDAMIHELSQHLKSLDAASSKRIAELEDIIRRKNTRVTKLQKDMLILEHKAMHLTRAKRSSTSTSQTSSRKVPFMSENVIYDMDSTTSPSSDSDCSRGDKPSMARKSRSYQETKLNNSSMKLPDHSCSSHPDGPLKEISENQKQVSSEKPKNSRRTEELKKMRRQNQPLAGFGSGFKNPNSSKRWV